MQYSVERGCYLTPLARAVLADEPDQLLVLLLDPVALMDRRLFVLIELVHALAIVSSGYKAGDLHPVVLVEFRRLDTLASRVVLDCPDQQPRLVGRPVLLRGVSLLALQLLQFGEDLGRLGVIHDVVGTRKLIGRQRERVFLDDAFLHVQGLFLGLKHAVCLQLSSLEGAPAAIVADAAQRLIFTVRAIDFHVCVNFIGFHGCAI